MAHLDIAPWEPEESVGKIWHFLASRMDPPVRHTDAAVGFDEMRGRIAVLFRGLGGGADVELKPVADQDSRHRISWRRRLAFETERLARASFDGATLRLPAELAVFPAREDNEALYLWLAAASAHAAGAVSGADPLRADLAAIAAGEAMVRATLAAAPGLRPVWARLCTAHLAARSRPGLRGTEAEVETLVRHLLGDPAQPDPALLAGYTDPPAHWRAPKGYRPFLPVPMWPDLRGLASGAGSEVASMPTAGTPEEAGDGTARKARRLKTDQAERKDSIILYKFEAMLSWAEMMNLNRRVEDDDLDNAKKAAQDHEEIVLGQLSKAPATKLKLHLDLAPEDVDRERIAAPFTYPEWEARTGAYLPDHCRVLAAPVAPDPAYNGITDDAARRRIRAVKRQFEALRPAKLIRHAQPDGEEIDLDAALRSVADLRATGRGSDRIWQQARPEKRDLAVSILLDVSRSTESAVTGRPVIDIAREALTALAWGLEACGDRFAIQGFSSLRRDRVWIHDCKSFDEKMGQEIEARIHALRPGFYTRLGAAIRHASRGLGKEAQSRRLMIVITDGKPNDLDHYEGRHGIEDSAMAVREARRVGHAVFGITIDRDAQTWFPRIFGQGGFALIRDPDRLTAALPEIYRQLVM
ncbi:nitric oxide reductase activation protein NorD [Pseudogemmobacter humi]|uniref:von Willebrand factor type A domain protein n=1 Tax=Pseudogemmobacter humi TaxID=2483812 RepID=A0A3P5XGZ3_9RHOB|nr:VWA domain-containing protein [Pseudogemmobacter humi]VDC29443.1 von Willebrand factor type A domain protein [Pseudogemmobacter humi]